MPARATVTAEVGPGEGVGSGVKGSRGGQEPGWRGSTSALLSLALTPGPSLNPLVGTSLCFQNPSISSPGPAATFSSLGSLLLPMLLRPCPPLCSEPPPPEFPPHREKDPTSLLTRSHRPFVTSSLSPTCRPHSASATLNPSLLPKRLARSNPRAFASAASPTWDTLSPHLLQVPRCAPFHHPGLSLNTTSSEASPSTLARGDRLPQPGLRYLSPFYILHISI